MEDSVNNGNKLREITDMAYHTVFEEDDAGSGAAKLFFLIRYSSNCAGPIAMLQPQEFVP